MFSPRIGLKPLAQLCRRAGTSLKAGVDARRIWAREAERGSMTYRRRAQQLRDAINRGESMTDALAATDGYFPRLFREMADVGEKTGKLDEVLLRLANHYDHLLTLRRGFLLAIFWPAIQLTMAVLIIGALIGVMGWIAGMTGETVDVLGFGLIGGRGMLIYFTIVTIVVGLAYALIRALLNGWLSATLMGLLMRIPVLGNHLRTMALSRMAWSLGLAIDAGMDARQSLRVALQSTRNQYFMRHQQGVDRALAKHREIHEALRQTGAFPDEFLDGVEVGEHSGRLSEGMSVLSDQYEQRARTASSALTIVASVGIWCLVAAILIAMIFRLAMFYIGTIQSFTEI